MRIEIVAGDQLAPEHTAVWSQLQQATPTLQSPFFRPEYTQAVAAVRNDVEVAVLIEGDQAVGFFPYQRDWRNVARPVGGNLSDFHGIVASSGVQLSAEDLLRGCRLRAWHFRRLLAAQELFQPYHCVLSDSAYVDLSNGFEAYREAQRRAGSHAIKRMMQKYRKVERELGGPLRLEAHTTDHGVFETLIDWKAQQYSRLNETNHLAPTWRRVLLERLVSLRSSAFSGVLSALYAGEELAAIHLGVRCGGVLHAWFPTYNPGLAKYSPGLLLWLELLRNCTAMGIHRIDLGTGASQLKDSLRSAAVRVAEGSVCRSAVRAALRRTWLRNSNRLRSTRLHKPAHILARTLRRLRDSAGINGR